MVRIRSILVFFAVVVSIAHADDSIEVEKWREDADAYVAQLLSAHDDPFHTTNEAAFFIALNEYKSSVEDMSYSERVVGLARIAALVGDGHTWMPLYTVPFGSLPPGPNFRVLPVRFELFDDGLFVVGADAVHEGLLGKKVVRFDDVDADEALARVLSILPLDAPQFSSELAPEWLMLHDILRVFGMAGEDNVVIGTAAGDKFPIQPLPGRAVMDWIFTNDAPPDGVTGWKTARQGRPPVFRQPRTSYWRMSEMDEVLYVQLLEIRNEENQTLREFGKSVAVRLSAMDRPKLVLDLRLTTGGDGLLNADFVAELAALKLAVEDFSVLIGRATHSAAIMLLSRLEQETQARFVGAPAGDRPNHHGETNIFVTPNSQLPIIYASEYYQTSFAGDDRKFHAPAIRVQYNFEHYKKGEDPVLSTALSHMNVSGEE
ncbi:MAG: hypothetical protein AAFW68_08500 [Pseudomonadota bacterium]